jgi:hypothetical protein
MPFIGRNVSEIYCKQLRNSALNYFSTLLLYQL